MVAGGNARSGEDGEQHITFSQYDNPTQNGRKELQETGDVSSPVRAGSHPLQTLLLSRDGEGLGRGLYFPCIPDVGAAQPAAPCSTLNTKTHCRALGWQNPAPTHSSLGT